MLDPVLVTGLVCVVVCSVSSVLCLTVNKILFYTSLLFVPLNRLFICVN